MSSNRNKAIVKLKVRQNTSREGVQAFQTEVIPNATYSGEALYKRIADHLGFSSNAAQVRIFISGMESAIMDELKKGNRLDFGLVSFFPKLSDSLPARDADPSEVGIYVRGAVKARKELSASLENSIVACNPVAGEPLNRANIFNVTRNEFDVVGKDDVLNIVGNGALIDRTMPDEGVWLEKRIKRMRQKHTVLVRAEILSTEGGQLRCRFTEVPHCGQYNLVLGTRAGAGPSYKVRYIRHLVRVVD